MKAYAYKSGEIQIDVVVPDGALPVLEYEDEHLLHKIIAKNARLVVPGIPEAKNGEDALMALLSFRQQCLSDLDAEFDQ